jgi:hypothetical protein
MDTFERGEGVRMMLADDGRSTRASGSTVRT